MNLEYGMNTKQQAAIRALDFVSDGMVIGLGTGTTTGYFIEMLGERIQSGSLLNVRGIPTSEHSAQSARSLGIPLVSLADYPDIDLAVDGADEVDPKLNLIKGMGRALLREKIVEIHARLFLVIVDGSKLVPRLGVRSPLPVEIVPFEAAAHLRWLSSLGCQSELCCESDGSPVVTDNGNYLATCRFENGIEDPYNLAIQLSMRPGIVEHGLFLDMAGRAIVSDAGGTRILEREK
jgi:ribose 5-phosphate isomerase A